MYLAQGFGVGGFTGQTGEITEEFLFVCFVHMLRSYMSETKTKDHDWKR